MFRILIADSSEMEIRFLTHFFQLHAQSYSLIGGATTREALLSFAGAKRPDILFLDTEFDDGNWLLVARSLRRLFPNLIIILNGLYPDFAAAQDAILLGVNAYILKPAEERQILETLNLVERAQNLHNVGFSLPGQKDNYPFAAEAKLMQALKNNDRQQLLDEARQYLYQLEKNYRGQDFRAFVCHLFLEMRWQLEHMGITHSLLHLLDTDLHIQDMAMAPGFLDMKKSIERYVERVAQTLTASEEVQPDCAELVTSYVRENFSQKITLGHLADRFHFSAAYIARCLKRSTGKTLSEYLNSLRIDKAVDLVIQTDLPIFKIASASGYTNVSHFNRVFHDITGMAPLQLRKNERYFWREDT